MTASLLLSLVAQFGPSIVNLVGQLVALKNAGDKPLTAEDFALLQKLASKTSADYLAEAERGP